MTTSHSDVPTSALFNTVIELAQATFSGSMPPGYAPRPMTPHPPAAARRRGWLERLDSWFARRQQRERDAYLAQSCDIFDLEYRIRQLERRGSY